MSLEEFHQLYDGEKPYREYWFGEAVPKPMATAIHGALQHIVMRLLASRGWKAASEVRLKIVPYAQPVPDIIASRARLRTLIRRSRWKSVSRYSRLRIGLKKLSRRQGITWIGACNPVGSSIPLRERP